MQIWSEVLRRKSAAWLALDGDYLHCPIWCRESLACRAHLHGVSKPAVLAELKSKLELICDTRI